MRPIRHFTHLWSVRVAASALFALGAAALAQSASVGGRDGSESPPGSPGLVRAPALPWTGDRTSPAGLVMPNGTVVVVSAGPWTPLEIYARLEASGLDSRIGAHLTVRVQNTHPPTRVTSSVRVDQASGRRIRQATLWLDAWPGTTFTTLPDWTIGHEMGHLWAAFYLPSGARDRWAAYLRVRGLAGDARLGSSHAWEGEEILAEDYRLLFGSPGSNRARTI